MLKFIKSFTDGVRDQWCDLRWWCLERGLSWFGEKLAMGVFIIIASFAVIVFSPLFMIAGCLYLIYFLGMWALEFVQWVRDKVAVTLLCTLGGLLVGVCGGTTGAAIGASFGFFLGIILELVRLTVPDKGDWLRFPYDGANDQPAGNGSALYNNNNYSGIVHVRHCEKPWTWKGFQVQKGPKEDDLRKDLYNG